MLKDVVRIVAMRRAAAERRLRDLRARHTEIRRHLRQLGLERERLGDELRAIGLIPDSMITAQVLTAVGDESRRIRPSMEERTVRQAALQKALVTTERSRRKEVRALLALQQKSDFLEKRERRAAKSQRRRCEAG